MDQPVPTIVVEPAKTNWLLFSLIGVAILIIGIVVGFFVGKYVYAPKPTPLPIVSVSPTPVSIADPTANWKIVTRKNWSLKAPNTWSYLECSDELLFVGPSISQDQTTECAFDGSPGVIQLVRAAGDSDRSISTNTNPAFDPYVSETSELSLDGKKAVKQQETIKDGQGAGTRIYVYINQPDYMDIIILHDITQKEVFNQILSTFRFLDSDIVLPLPQNWKVYQNSDIKLGYPSDWTVSLETSLAPKYSSKTIVLKMTLASSDVRISVSSLSGQDLQASLSQFIKDTQGDFQIIPVVPTLPDRAVAYVMQEGPSGTSPVKITYLVLKMNKKFIYISTILDGANLQTLDQIVRTFDVL